MKFKILSILILLMYASITNGQTDHVIVEKLPFCSDKRDEFSPVYFKNGLVFCANTGKSGMVSYYNKESVGQFDIFFISHKKMDTRGGVKNFSRQLNSKFNDGPVTFNSKEDVIYFSRNIHVKVNKDGDKQERNKLGIYSATLEKKKWKKIKQIRFNSEWYNITTPCLSPDGKRLYFSSDKPEGFGGADLYYCELNNGFWEKPINLGAEINTKGNESFPYVNNLGELFFSSDGHPGLGVKDVFVTKQDGSNWFKPIGLEAPINSAYNDFGIIADSLFNTGYFSSDRHGSNDIFKFNTAEHSVWFSKQQIQNEYCVVLSGSEFYDLDTVNLEYEWEFEDKIKLYGNQVKRCFNGSGIYRVKLNIVDRISKRFYFYKNMIEIEIEDKEQPFITSPDYAIVGEQVTFDGKKSNCPGYELMEYHWDFGDGTLLSGTQVNHAFDIPGEHVVKLGVVVKSEENGKYNKLAVSKKLMVFPGIKEKKIYETSTLKGYQNDTNSISRKIRITNLYDAELDDGKETTYRLQVLSSKRKVSFKSDALVRVPAQYAIKEIYYANDGTYRYFVAENAELISLYPAFEEMMSAGFTALHVKKDVLDNLAEIELSKLVKRYGVSIDDYFDRDNLLKSNGLLMINKIVELLKAYPDINFEIRVHTDNLASASRNKWFSQYLAQRITNAMLAKGINSNRLSPVGIGEILPIRSNLLENGRKKNRRIEFKIIHND